jgi:excisionase family DNA binding protein
MSGALAFLSHAALEELDALIEERIAEAVERRLRDCDGGWQTSPYMTIAEAADYLRCRRQRIDDLLSQRRLTRYKDGRRTLVSRAEIEGYLGTSGDEQ